MCFRFRIQGVSGLRCQIERIVVESTRARKCEAALQSQAERFPTGERSPFRGLRSRLKLNIVQALLENWHTL